ncbi:hypothetical protein [Carnobacterium divergens]|uniref:hypothetical protein n=1 Tax=Carnobacterium divergens TaxID=2748 RepID=UPI00128C44F6|nr:hypothetical protein [Carnobacterium divergens]MPQ21232.1 hypothetical protein [Carnobacterium divergens]
MKKMWIVFLVIFLIGCGKVVNLENKKSKNSQANTITEKEELGINKLYGTWNSDEKKYSVTLKETDNNKDICLTINDTDSTIISFDSFDSKYNVYTFLSEKLRNNYRIVVVNNAQIIFNYGTTEEDSEGVTQRIELKKSN